MLTRVIERDCRGMRVNYEIIDLVKPNNDVSFEVLTRVARPHPWPVVVYQELSSQLFRN